MTFVIQPFMAIFLTFGGFSSDPISDISKVALAAKTFEHKRSYGSRLHGKIVINGRTFHFVSGGRARGSAPFGTYKIGDLGGFTAPRGTFVPGYPLTDSYDELTGDERTGLFIHPARGVTAGCIGINKNEWAAFVRAMRGADRPTQIVLEPANEPMIDDAPRFTKFVSFKKTKNGHKKSKVKRNHKKTKLLYKAKSHLLSRHKKTRI